MKQANKGFQPVVIGQPSAEFVEKRPPAKGNSCQSTVTRTQGLEASLSGLARVREAAIRDPHLQFTNVYHHITIELLRKVFFSLNKKAAPGVDGVTWASYKDDLDSHLEDLHERIQSGRY